MWPLAEPAADFAAMQATIDIAGRCWRADLTRSWDVSIPLDFAGAQPSFYGAPPARSSPLCGGDFSGQVRTGASCNCATYSLTPHCNGTHTESVGHVTPEMRSVHALARDALFPAQLLSAQLEPADQARAEHDPATQAGDLLVTARTLRSSAGTTLIPGARALIVRTLPNPAAKRVYRYGSEQPAPYFTSAAMRWIVAQGIEHLVVDLPSLDRSDDGGELQCHRIFWGMAPRGSADPTIARPHATVTELAYVADELDDGAYLLSLQIAPFVADAAPSRPLLYPMVPL